MTTRRINPQLRKYIFPGKISKSGVDDFDTSFTSVTSFSESSDTLAPFIAVPKDNEITTNDKSQFSKPRLGIDLAVVQSEDEASLVSSNCSSETIVRFSTIGIREYPICIGDNPCCTLGVPLAIGWEYDDRLTCSVDEYEKTRPYRRSAAEIKIPSLHRFEILKSLGYSRQAINEATKEAARNRSNRSQTSNQLGRAPFEELVEMVKRAFLNATIRRDAKRKEREYLSLCKPKTKKI